MAAKKTTAKKTTTAKKAAPRKQAGNASPSLLRKVTFGGICAGAGALAYKLIAL